MEKVVYQTGRGKARQYFYGEANEKQEIHEVAELTEKPERFWPLDAWLEIKKDKVTPGAKDMLLKFAEGVAKLWVFIPGRKKYLEPDLKLKGTKYKKAKEVEVPKVENKTGPEIIADAEQEIWRDFASLCKLCEKDCKQSHLARVLVCPSYKKAVV